MVGLPTAVPVSVGDWTTVQVAVAVRLGLGLPPGTVAVAVDVRVKVAVAHGVSVGELPQKVIVKVGLMVGLLV